MPTIALNDISLYYDQQGEGPDLVLIAGLSSDHQAWKSLARHLSPYFRILLFDNRGAGLSSAPEMPYSIEMMAQDTLSLMAYLGIKKAHILGHSMGGAIAMQIALQAPEAVDKLIVACSRHKISAISSLFFSMREKLQAMHMPSELLAEYAMPFLFSENFLQNTVNVTGFTQWSARNPNLQTATGFTNQLNATRTKNFGDTLKNIQANTLIIGGSDDIIAPQKETTLLASLIPNAILRIIENSAHMPHVEQSKLFSEITRDFLIS